MHHLPRQLFGGKVHLFGDTVQFNSSIFLEAEGGLIAITILKRLVREAKPAAGDTEGDLVCADFNDCVMPTVESVGGGVGAKQRCPGGPKFPVEFCIQPLPQGLKPLFLFNFFGTAKAVPLSETYRSISPRTMSMEPMTATTSARRRPLHIVSSACSVAKDGLRMWTR